MNPAKASSPSLDRGGLAEEALRQYFRELGSFVLRGVPVKESNEHVSDIDLWIYTRSSPLARHIAIVDIKNKRKGKAFERAVWVKGLQIALKADEAIIASQGAKDSVYGFAGRLDVRVLSSTVFDAILKRYAVTPDRITLEEIESQWRSVSIGSETLKSKMDLCRSEISKGLRFSALNIWIDQSAELVRLMVERERKQAGPITRALYYCCSLLAISADYLGKEHSLSDATMRKDHFREGLLYGRTDGSVGSNYLDFAESLATEFLDRSGAAAAQMRRGFESTVSSMPIGGFVELFSKSNAGAELLKAANALEAAAFSTLSQRPAELATVEAKTIIGLVGDYAGQRRVDVLGTTSKARVDAETDTNDGGAGSQGSFSL